MSKSEATQRVLDEFAKISQVPRPSKHEEKIAAYLMQWAEDHGFEAVQDAVKNVVIKVPAGKGYENGPILVLQGHMDMVCEKRPDVRHDFMTDPIRLIEEDGWLRADGTTLGADDGIGVALALALATDPNVGHPALEILITSDEETGMTGALGLQGSLLQGRILLNLDSEDEGVFTVGCAGGRDTKGIVQLYRASVPSSWTGVKVKVGGLKGGHSGVDVNKGHASAIKLAARTLRSLSVASPELLLTDIRGGSAHNAIPRDAEFVCAVPQNVVDILIKTISQCEQTFRQEYAHEENLRLTIEEISVPTEAFDRSGTDKVTDLLYAFPHGVASMVYGSTEMVETSNNLATVSIEDGKLKITSSQRSAVASRIDAITGKIEATLRLSGGVAISGKGYPAWQPYWESELLKKCKELYASRFGKEPKIEVIHAGLECGIIGSKVPGMEMISLGPTVLGAHSPDERLEIASVGLVYDFLTHLVESYK